MLFPDMTPKAMKQHETMGFTNGWGTVAEQLVEATARGEEK